MAKKKKNKSISLGIEGTPQSLVRATIYSSGAISQYEPPDDIWSNVINDIITPPYDPDLWAGLLKFNTRLKKLIHAMARNTVGLGYEFIDADTKMIPKSKKFKNNVAAIKDLFERPNDDVSFDELMCRVKIDEESTGNGYMEVTRNGAGKIDGLVHCQAITMRRRKDSAGYIQVTNSGEVVKYFKNFGDIKVMNADTGEYASSGLSREKRATEVIQFISYSPEEYWYGVPRAESCSPSITGNWYQGLRNVYFFQNDATPRIVFTIHGGKLTAKSAENIETFLRRKNKGHENPGRVLVLEVDANKKPGGEVDKTDIKITPLTVGKSEDASFQDYRLANDEEIREAFGIAKIFLGTAEDVNRATALVLRDITNDQIFMPESSKYEYIINQKIIRDLFDGELPILLKFKRPSAESSLDIAEMTRLFSLSGGLSINNVVELAAKTFGLSLEPYPYEWADVPINIALTMLKGGESSQRPRGPGRASDGDGGNDTAGQPGREDDGESGEQNLSLNDDELELLDGLPELIEVEPA